MAIAFDASSGNATIVTDTISWSHTCTGSDLILFVAVTHTNTTTVSGITYNGVALTQITTVGSGSAVDLWYLLNPATGSNTVAVTLSGTANQLIANASSYTGAQQSGVPDASNTNSNLSSSLSVSVTTVADNCWTVIAAGSYYDPDPDLPVTPDSGTTVRDERNTGTTGFQGFIGDSNGAITPAGSTSLGFSRAGTAENYAVVASFAPAGGGGGVVIPALDEGMLTGGLQQLGGGLI